MKTALIIYGTTTGNTETMAEMIQTTLRQEGLDARLLEVTGASVNHLAGTHDVCLLGCPAYGDQEVELQDDFAEI